MLNVTQFGTCRTLCINDHVKSTNLHETISFTHNTKEHLQLIQFITEQIIIPPEINQYCFRTSILYPRKLYEKKFGDPINNQLLNFWEKEKHLHYIEHDKKMKILFDNTDIFIVEISSLKKYIYNNYYLHHLAVDKRFGEWQLTDKQILDNYVKIEQTYEEIEKDIQQIKDMVQPKKLIILTHINAKINNEHIKSRNMLINMVEDITKKNNILCFNPTIALEKFRQNDIISNDLGHYEPFGGKIVGKLLFEKIKEII